MIIRKLKQWWTAQDQRDDPLIEGWYADQYSDHVTKDYISREYQSRHQYQETPLTHPWLFDPLAPPQGWRYDPYYECWLTHTEY
jgi:hypothetical protein